jgi:hypothetical protein
MPLPSDLSSVHHQAHRALDVELEVVEAGGFVRHHGKQVTVLIVDP